MSLESYLRAAPKAELHVHLEGTIRPASLIELARRNGIALPADTVEGIARWYDFPSFARFIEVYVTITRCLRTAADYEFVVLEYAAELARQNARYAEVTFSPSTHALTLGIPEETFIAGLARGRDRARRELGVELNWIFDIVRDARDPATYYAYTTRVAIEHMAQGVVALGLAGLETDSGPEPYVWYFDQARVAGLHCVAHAGELSGPASVWGALGVLKAERIGHGVRSIEDPALVAYLAEHRIPLELNPTSNARLGVVPSLDAHPLRRLHDAGVTVVVSSDDPALFHTTLADEVATLATIFGFTAEEVALVDGILLNAVHQSFLPEERRNGLGATFRAELDRLKAIHL